LEQSIIENVGKDEEINLYLMLSSIKQNISLSFSVITQYYLDPRLDEKLTKR